LRRWDVQDWLGRQASAQPIEPLVCGLIARVERECVRRGERLLAMLDDLGRQRTGLGLVGPFAQPPQLVRPPLGEIEVELGAGQGIVGQRELDRLVQAFHRVKWVPRDGIAGGSDACDGQQQDEDCREADDGGPPGGKAWGSAGGTRADSLLEVRRRRIAERGARLLAAKRALYVPGGMGQGCDFGRDGKTSQVANERTGQHVFQLVVGLPRHQAHPGTTPLSTGAR
jgi:hypothetical protein